MLEFDPDRVAIINPEASRSGLRLPPKAVLCFFQDVLERLAGDGKLEIIGELRSEMGSNPIYRLERQGELLTVIHPGVGAPLAAGFLEEIIALGARGLIACGGCGVLDEEIAVGHPVVLTGAVRDEGTSYHYLPPGREVTASPQAVAALERALQRSELNYLVGKSWTTDGLYRETPGKRARRVAEGCIVVEMEAAAFFAVAEYRGVLLGQVVYGGDLVVPNAWDKRDWVQQHGTRELLFWVAVEACVSMTLH
ncbi:MAG: nucleoside phosphorylase [Anaerolineaceae bacterium]|nr:nucleoside phosphorylase [Anaerolineaceae bacterium]